MKSLLLSVRPYVSLIIFASGLPFATAAEPNAQSASSRLAVVVLEGPSASLALCGPLGVKLPDYGSILANLRDDLLDEQAQSPAGPREAYDVGVQLCASWLQIIQERQKRQGSADLKVGASTDMHHSKRDQLKPWEYMRLLKEMAEENQHKSDDNQKDRYIENAKSKEWADQSARFRQSLDNSYRRLRAYRRQSPTFSSESNTNRARSLLDSLEAQKQALVGDALAPLDSTRHDPWARITLLREDLYDEAMLRPATERPAYLSAGRLCDAMIAASEEWEKTHQSLGQTLPPTLMGGKAHTDEMQKNFDEAVRKRWQQRCAVLQQNFDQIFHHVLDLRAHT